MKGYAQRVVDFYRTRNYGPITRLVAAKLRRRTRASSEPTRLLDEPWSLERAQVEGDELVVQGWALPPIGEPFAPREFRANGRRFDVIRHPLPRPDAAAFFRARADADQCGFEGRTPAVDVYPGGYLEIERVRPGATPVDRGRDVSVVADPMRHANLPDADRRYRVIANRDAGGFLNTGATDYRRLDRVVTAVSGRRLHEFDRVLDWGCGCGRVARHFPRSEGHRLVGCDIDHDNVRWCTENLPGRFVPSGMVPPLPFDRGSFDAVYGISVFTHLREPLQVKWLDELARITRTGALLLMTVHGRTAIEFGQLPREEQARFADVVGQAGLVVTGSNSQIDGFADHAGEYVNVFHSHDYIRRTWSRRFAIVAILPGYLFTHDLVVMRK